MAELPREKFFKVYANLPLNLRQEVVLVLDSKEPITWNVAYLEIVNNTELGAEIFKKLEDLGII